MERIYLVFEDKGGGIYAPFGAYATHDLAASAAESMKGLVVELPVLTLEDEE